MGDYPFTDQNPEEVAKTLDAIFNDVINNREKWFLICDKDKKPVAVIMNAEEHMYLKNLLGRK